MDQSERVSLRVLLGIEIACFAVLIFGVLTACSPFWTPGGLLGWWDGYTPQEDIMGIRWLSGSLLSILLGIILCIAAAATGIWIGIAAGIVGLVSNRADRGEASFTAAKDLGDAASKKPPIIN